MTTTNQASKRTDKQTRNEAGETMMIRNHTFLRSVSAVTLCAFMSLTMYPLAAAAQAHDVAEKAGILRQQKDEGVVGNAKRYLNKLSGNYDAKPAATLDDRLGQLLNDIHENLKALVPETALPAHPGQSGAAKKSALSDADVNARIASIRGKTAEIKALNADVAQGFKDTEKRLRDANLPQEILDRHNLAVLQYQNRKAEFERLTAKIEQASDSNDKAGRQTALADLGTFMAKYPNAKPHQYGNPNKLPFGTNSSKVREPYTTASQFQASLFPPKYESVMLAGAIPDGLQLAQATLPPIPNAPDLAETDDVQITQAIKDQATALNNNPVKIYNWVRNNIAFIPSYGSIQGSEMTRQNKRGNAFDTASLLIAMYRAAGIPARYVYGTIDVPAAKAMNWVGGADNTGAVQSLLGQGGIPNAAVISGGTVKTIRMEHIWVEAYVDNSPGRGAINKKPGTWVPMDPSFKQYQFKQGMNVSGNVPIDGESLLTQFQQGATIDTANGYVQNLNQTNLQSQLSTYQNQVKTYIGNTLSTNGVVGDVLGAQTIVAENMPILAGSLPYKTVATGSVFQALPDNLRWKFRTNIYAADGVSDGSSPIIEINRSTPSLAGKKITLSFIPATQADQDLIISYLPAPHADGTPILASEFPAFWPGYLLHMKAQYRVDGKVVSQTTDSFTMGSTVNQSSQYFNPANGTWDGGEDNGIIVGEYNAIGIDLQGVGPQQVQNHLAKASATKAKLDLYQQNTSDTTPLLGLTEDDLTGDLVQSGILGYFAQVDTSDHLAALSANKMITYRLPSYGRFFTSVQPHYFFGIVRNVSYPGVVMDVDYLRYHVAAKDDNAATNLRFMKQAGAAGSAAEHAVPESIFRNPNLAANDPGQPKGISAVKALAIASAQGQKIYTLNQNNYALQSAILQSLRISEDVKSEIADALAAGREVTVHEADLSVNGWTGNGYIITDPATGSGTYKIDGGSNGADVLTTLLSGASGYLDGLTRFKDHWFNAGNAATYAKISGILTVFAAVFTVVNILNDSSLSVTQKIAQIVINIGSAIAMLGISEAIMGTALLAVSNPILLGLLIATIAITLSILTMELVLFTTTQLANNRMRRIYA